MQKENDDSKYTFELKDLSYDELVEVYKEMITFVDFLKKEMEGATIVKESSKGEK